MALVPRAAALALSVYMQKAGRYIASPYIDPCAQSIDETHKRRKKAESKQPQSHELRRYPPLKQFFLH